jgi:hypothetical protein
MDVVADTDFTDFPGDNLGPSNVRTAISSCDEVSGGFVKFDCYAPLSKKVRVSASEQEIAF